MIKIAIVEDEHAYAMQLQDYLHQYENETGLVLGGIGITYQGACILAQTWNQDLALDFGHMDRRQMIEAGGDGSLRYYKDEEFTFDSESVSDYHYGREAAHHIYKPTKRQFARIAKKAEKKLAKANK